jgi:16S rRNA processing protein RimM
LTVAEQQPPDPTLGHLLLGRLGKTFGLEGALRFKPLGPAEAEAIFDLNEVFVAGLGRATIREVREHGNRLLITFEAVRQPERARKLVNAQVFAPLESLPEPSGGTLYLEAVSGLPVIVDGRPFGTVAELMGVSGAELLRVERPQGPDTLIPLRAPYVQLGEHAVMVEDPPAGLIGPDEAR